MKRSINLIVLFLLAAGCNNSQVVDTWHDPNFVGPIRFKKTLVIAITKDPGVERIAEDEIVSQMGEDRSVQAYKLLTDAERADSAHLRPKLEAMGVDGVVTMKLVDTKSQTQWIPGSGPYPYDGFYTYYDRSLPVVGDPGYMVTTTTARIQTNIYSVADGKMIWTGISETFDPSNVKGTVGDVCKAIGKQLKKDGMLP